MTNFLRYFPLDDIAVRSGGDGRTVEAYCAVFDSPTEIHDHQGEYREVLHPTSFDRTISNKGTKFGVLFNHGLTIHGTPSDRGTMPIGTPLEVRADSKGVYTVTRYNDTPLADETLDAIKSGSITAQSFSGRFVRSDKDVPKRGFRRDASGELPTVTRIEVEMREYGPAVFAAYPEAAITGVRGGYCTCPACLLSRADATPETDPAPVVTPASDSAPDHSLRHQMFLLRLKLRQKGVL